MNKYLLASLGILAFMGAGCGEATNKRDTSSDAFLPPVDDISDEDAHVALSCDEGMELFQGTRHNIEFCYPENNGQDGEITVKEEFDGVVLSVGGEAMRKIWVVDVDGSERREDIVERYAVVNPAGVVCGVMSAFNDIEGRDVYVLVGEDASGEQNSSTVAACTYASSDAQGGFDLNVLRSGIFYFYDRVPGTMFVLSSEQDPSLGSQTDAFVASIQPKE